MKLAIRQAYILPMPGGHREGIGSEANNGKPPSGLRHWQEKKASDELLGFKRSTVGSKRDGDIDADMNTDRHV